MSIMIKVLLLLIVLIERIDGRALRERRQTATNSFGQDMSNMFSYGYNTIRDNVVPTINSASNRFSQNWDQYKQNVNQGINQLGQTWDYYRQNINQGINQGVNQLGQTWDHYKQNLNQGINQLGQGWNRFMQNFNPQYPYNTNNNYGYYQYDYNNQQYPNAGGYNYPQNMYQNYGQGQRNPYPAGNYYNGYGMSGNNLPYYASNTGGQYRGNLGGQQQQQQQQQRYKRAVGRNPRENINQRPEPQRR